MPLLRTSGGGEGYGHARPDGARRKHEIQNEHRPASPDVKPYEKKQMPERMKELQDIPTPVEKEAEKLQVIATKAKEEYGAALSRVADQTH